MSRPKRKYLVHDLPAAAYHARPETSISRLKVLQQSPLHYQFRLANPITSTAMTRGSVTHTLTLEPHKFPAEYLVWNRRTDSGRMAPRSGKAWDEFLAEAGSRKVVTEEDHATASAMSSAVLADPIAARYLRQGDAEVSMFWLSGKRPCRGRVDWLTKDGREHVVVGLKTVRDCRPDEFSRAAHRLGYHLQWAFYHDGYKSITRRTPRMVEIVVESEPPHAVVTYVIPEDVLAQGRDEYAALLQRLDVCEREKRWPGPAEAELQFSLPTWAYSAREDEELTGGADLNWEGIA